ncbi:MAG: group II intron reverse transcriptase/maturase [Candidatus Wenzhouxiangella sp. M2_3B_020]
MWTERMVEALKTRETWYSLIDKVHAPATLESAWRRVRANDGAAGVDKVSVERFGRTEAQRLGRLGEQLRSGRYRAQPVRRAEIPKLDGGRRALGIPTVGDRVVQAALEEVIEPIFESRFEPRSYGFRPGRGCKDALRDVDAALRAGQLHVVDADLKGYFDSIPHDRLLEQVFARIKDGAVLQLIEGFLRQGILSEAGLWTPETGTPQGAVLSPLLANLYLHPLDVEMRQRGFHMVRYADDFVVLCPTAAQAEEALALIRDWVEQAGLCLHPEKTQVADLTGAGGCFDFLGYRFYSREDGGIGRRIKPKKRKALYARLAQLTPRKSGLSTAVLIHRINVWLRGVFAYFKHAERRALATIDAHIRYRLRRIFAKRRGLGGCAKRWKAHQLWRNSHFVALGLFSMATARDAIPRSHSGHA